MSRVALMLSLAWALAPAAQASGGPQHFALKAAYEPAAKPGTNGAVAVTFTPLDPDLHVNETPGPRLKLPADGVLVDKQPPAPDKLAPYDPESATYLDLALPVYFPVAVAKGAPKGAHHVPVTLTYFYCSKRAGWCRKGTAELSVAVSVP
jgi:hypothetical protein